jgi:hypothetical protein
MPSSSPRHWGGASMKLVAKNPEKEAWPAPPHSRRRALGGSKEPGLGASSWACSLATQEQMAAGRDEIFRSPHPQEVENDKQNEMLGCNYTGSQACLPPLPPAAQPPACTGPALGNEVLPDPRPQKPAPSPPRSPGQGKGQRTVGSGSSSNTTDSRIRAWMEPRHHCNWAIPSPHPASASLAGKQGC